MSETIWRAHGLLNNAFEIYSPQRGGHRSGNDAIFLAASVDPQTQGHAADFGAATGAAGFAVAYLCPAIHMHLIEIDEAARSQIDKALALQINAPLRPRIQSHLCDLTDKDALQSALRDQAGRLQTIIANPPFNDAGHRSSPDLDRARSHHMPQDALDAWVKAARMHLAPKGRVHWITRPSGLTELLNALSPAFGDIRIRPIHGHEHQAAQRVLVRATKGSRAALQLLPPFIVHQQERGYSDHADAVLRGKSHISMDVTKLDKPS